ncbi:MAG: transcription-repair coupling factor [candidate division Zixibacteria bacterium]|nr:transcription-repair coupling factor [candidate division Zixibacteria bacterium]
MDTRLSQSKSRLDIILRRFYEYPPFEKLRHSLYQDKKKQVKVTGLAGCAESLLITSLVTNQDRPLVVITRNSETANDLYDDLVFLLGESKVGHYPSRQILPYDFKAPVGEIMGRRIWSLSGLRDNACPVIICPVRAMVEPTIPVSVLNANRVDIKKGEEVNIEELVAKLLNLGFRSVRLVEEVGDFARRGGLIDIFTPGSEAPVRVEFFGDEVETIRQFDVAGQRTIGHLERVQILPRREIPITQDTLEKYLACLPERDADFIRARYINDPELPGLEWLSLLFGIEQGSFLDYIGDSRVVFVHNREGLKEEFENLKKEAENLYMRLEKKLSRIPTPEEYYFTVGKVEEFFNQTTVIDYVPFRGGREDVILFDCQPHPAFGSRLDLLEKTLKEFNVAGLSYFIATDSRGQAERLEDLLSEKIGLDEKPPVEVADLNGGFVCNTGGMAVLTDHEIFSRYHRRIRKKKFREGMVISDYTQLNKGDFVVHTDFGIARYLGLETITVDNRNRDCLYLQYAEGDRLFVPIEEFNRVAKYSGKDSAPPLSHLGTPGWEKLKKKTRKAVADMAADLIKLYAERKSHKGFSFGEDSVWLKQLEASFIYEETPDQGKAIIDVKRDMSEEKPMDRLVCGDVGYGKTEVAVRAAFKAVDAGKQVAVLVPTTILAQQHMTTFSERLAEFPVKIAMLSRFKTRTQQLEIVKELGEGTIDLVIGTHRLLSGDVKFKDLGLLIVDEEHRFGVRHKEKLRRLKATVDTLAMSATPIPRTLQMSLMGVRDMSLINTSPKDRLPIITEIVEFDAAVITTAILREMERGGQVFFVHNRVQTIEAMHHYLQKIVPQARIAVAHGQMHERSLEGIMLAFLARQYDVLLCTSIIESGLDIPSANTIIINRGDRFGLAQLYQLRGRVGRSSRRAYAYLLTPPTKLLTADAVKRLRALEAHSDLGSGFALAMRDLEIRGAGTILGARQSGYMEELGFDLYNKILEETVAELKGEEIVRLPETKLEMNIEIYLPDYYITDSRHKVDIYRRLADCYNLDQVEKIREEITDRFGHLPPSAVNLFEATAVKILAGMLGMKKVRIRDGRVTMRFSEEHPLTRKEIEAFRHATDQPLEFSLFGQTVITLDLSQINEQRRLNYLRGILVRV